MTKIKCFFLLNKEKLEIYLVLGQTSLTFIEDFSPINTPSGQSRRFYISNTSSNNTKQQQPNQKKSTSATNQLTTRLKTIIEGSEHTK